MNEPTIKLDDRELAEVNRLLPWIFYQRDSSGRQVGYGREWRLIDTRIEELAQRYEISGKSILEPGSLDGHMTLGLCALGAHVTAFDARPVGALKTFAKLLSYGYSAKILVHDARRMHELGTFDCIFHSGVFYHLADPVAHLRQVKDMAPVIMLDTHTAHPNRPIETVQDGYQGNWYDEYGWVDHQSGVEDRSLWLTADSLARLFDECGFDCETVFHHQEWDNGPRGLYLLRKR